jgi:purine catabolism regulator
VLVAGLRPWCVSVGAAGPRAGADGLRAACREAERALKLSSQLFGRGSLTHFADLGAYRVLFRLQGTPEAESFLNEMLGALEAYDRQHHAELLPTLEAYFGASCSPQETAARLHLHRNTVLYRLQRIADISGYRLDDPSARFDLQLALRLHRALRTEAAI